MKHLKVQSLPVKEVIIDLANALNIPYTDNCNIYTLEIPKEIGEGFIEGLDFEVGLGMLNYSCMFHEDIQVNFTFKQLHPLKFLHCYGSNFEHRFEDDNQVHLVEKHQNLIVASSIDNGHILNFKANVPVKICSIEIDRINFIKKLPCIRVPDKHFLTEVILDIKGIKRFYYQGKYSLKLTNIINEILHYENLPLLMYLFYQGKSLELLTNQYEQYLFNMENSYSGLIIRKVDTERIHEMVNYIEFNIDKKLSIKDLQQVFLMDRRRMQGLFKAFYGSTVKAFITKKRMEKAAEYLENTDMNISEIAYAIGIESKSHFTKTFKETYQMTPSNYLKNIINTKLK